MKKVFSRLFSLVLVSAMMVLLVGCDKGPSVKAAFEEKGYTVETLSVDEDSDILALFLDEDERAKVAEYECIYVKKNLSSGLIIKMPSEADVREFYAEENDDGTKDYTNYEDAKEAGRANGNCILFTFSADVRGIFEKA